MTQESDLLRYLEGECTPAEAAAIQAWLAADPQRCEQFEELRVVWRHTGVTARRWDVARARERLRRARGLDTIVPPAPSMRRSRWSDWRAWSVAAGVIIMLAASATYLATRTPSFRTYQTDPGQRLTLSLPDGSRVLLSAASRLRIALPFSARARVIELQGEAYFIVQHDARRPFLVRTEHGVAQDLGTEFNVREYPQDHGLQVVVTSGQVVLRARRTTHPVARTLSAHDRGVISVDGRVAVDSNVQLESYLAWTEGRLVFDQTPLRDIITELERWYDVEIETQDRALEDERVTIVFAQQTADQALSELATVVHARYARRDRRVQLVRDHPPQ